LQVNAQALMTHVACALLTVVVQTLPQVLQLLALLVVSAHVVPQSVGLPDEHPDRHE
jgi:hypothetical protein